jgi:hypothetical protein
VSGKQARMAWAITHSLRPKERLVAGLTWTETSRLIRSLFKYLTVDGKGYPPVKWVKIERVRVSAK